MKKLLTAFAMALLLVGCAKEYDDTELKNRVTTLETKMDNLVAQMQVVQKVALGEFVQKVEETTDGLTITYGDGTVLTVHVSTGSGAGTLSVLKNAAGDLCWAIDGTILQYDGKDLVVGAVSNIYVENGKLYAVINGEAKELGGFSGGSELKDGIFTNLAVTDEAVVLTLSDGSTIKLPLANAFKLVIAKTKYAVTTTDPFNVPYTVQAKTNNTVVDIFTDGNYSATVEADKFVITPKAAVEGSALAYADSQVGLTSIVKLSFGEEGEEDYAEIADEPVSEEIDYLGEAANGVIEAHVVSNASIDVKSEADWISVTSVKATTYTVTLTLDDNTTNEIRYGEVKVYAKGTENVLQTITVAQKASEIEYEYYNPAGWNKVFDMSNYKTNSTFIWKDKPIALNPSSVTLQWKFYANKWNNHKFEDKDEAGNKLYSNRLGEFATADESKSVLFRFSNDGDADGQLCLNAGVLGVGQAQVKKGGKPYAWPAGKWVTMSIVSDGSTVSVYQDNTLLESYDATPASDWNLERVDLSMTWDNGSNWPLAQAFNGYTAYIRVWSKALAVSEIEATLCEIPADKADGLEACWNFDGSTDKWVENSVEKNADNVLDFTDCWDGNNTAKDNGDAAAAAWTTLKDSEMDGICSRVASSTPDTPDTPDEPATTMKALSFAKQGAQNWYVFQNDIDLSNGYTYVVHFLSTKVDALWPIMMKISAKATQSDPTCHRFMNSQDRTGASDFAHIAVSWNNGTNVHVPAKDVTLEANTWYSLAWTNDATNGPRLYMDGVLVNSGTPDADAISKMLFGAIEFGDSWGDDGYTPKPYPGCLSMISVWDKALSAEEVAALVKKAPANLKDEHLKAYWPMNEGEGGVLKEATGKYEDIDFHYGWSERYGGTYGTGEDLDNTEYLEWIEVPAIGEGNVTPTPDPDPDPEEPENVKGIYWGNANASAWFKDFPEAIDLSNGYTAIIHFVYESAEKQRLCNFGSKDEFPCNMFRFGEKNDNNQLEWMVDAPSSSNRIKLYAGGFKANEWGAVTVSYATDGTAKMYANGVLTDTQTGSFPTSGVAFQGIEFANSWGDSYRSAFKGTIAYVSIWNKVLSDTEVAANVFKVPSGEGLQLFWKMTEGEGFVFTESAGVKPHNEYTNFDIDLRYMTRCNDETNYVEFDSSSYVEWKEYPPFAAPKAEEPAGE